MWMEWKFFATQTHMSLIDFHQVLYIYVNIASKPTGTIACHTPLYNSNTYTSAYKWRISFCVRLFSSSRRPCQTELIVTGQGEMMTATIPERFQSVGCPAAIIRYHFLTRLLSAEQQKNYIIFVCHCRLWPAEESVGRDHHVNKKFLSEKLAI